MSSDALLAAPIILDNGSGTIRAGFAGSDIPKCIFPSFVGRPKHTKVLAGGAGSEGDVFVGNKAEELRGLLKLNWPLQHGVVTDWTDVETIWSWVYREGLGVGSDMVCLLLGMLGCDALCSTCIAASTDTFICSTLSFSQSLH